ncbi:hypothetical protein RF11_08774 [Thelohanellus kitauei]|uniref:Tc1-like transposase DDE domain-containing protein n=1 Tax=Thelohanellus kitauei TaxID=669202 RepID=A0A0C2JPJ2_THEKT|nr:hypothetical protein RF11_08774 [Thelohanellus kitauei]
MDYENNNAQISSNKNPENNFIEDENFERRDLIINEHQSGSSLKRISEYENIPQSTDRDRLSIPRSPVKAEVSSEGKLTKAMLLNLNKMAHLVSKQSALRLSDQKYTNYRKNFPDEKIHFVDKVRFILSMRLKMCRALIGTTTIPRVPNIRVVKKEINTSPYNEESFLGYAENFFRHIEANSLMATRRAVNVDNVRFHKASTIMECFDRNGHEISFLQPY